MQRDEIPNHQGHQLTKAFGLRSFPSCTLVALVVNDCKLQH